MKLGVDFPSEIKLPPSIRALTASLCAVGVIFAAPARPSSKKITIKRASWAALFSGFWEPNRRSVTIRSCLDVVKVVMRHKTGARTAPFDQPFDIPTRLGCATEL